MSDWNVQVSMEVLLRAESVHARLRYANLGEVIALLYKPHIPEPLTTAANLFKIESGGLRCRYTGLKVKRPEPTVDDFLPLSPGEVLLREISLTSQYQFLPQPAVYVVQYSAYHSPPNGSVVHLKSSPVEFTWPS